nr:hypothetical protein CFP56_60909 [Quercus suber]
MQRQLERERSKEATVFTIRPNYRTTIVHNISTGNPITLKVFVKVLKVLRNLSMQKYKVQKSMQRFMAMGCQGCHFGHEACLNSGDVIEANVIKNVFSEHATSGALALSSTKIQKKATEKLD